MLFKQALTTYKISRQSVYAKLNRQNVSLDKLKDRTSGVLTEYGEQWFSDNYGQRIKPEDQQVKTMTAAAEAMTAKWQEAEAERQRLQTENEALKKQVADLTTAVSELTISIRQLTQPKITGTTGGVVGKIRSWFLGSKTEKQ